MSSQFRGYCKSDGAVRLGFFSLFGANFHRGMLVDSDYFGNPVACAELNGVPANYIGGIPVTAAGRICISESAVSGNGPSGGLRVTAAGKLACVQTSPNVIHQGVGLSSEGALCYESAIPRGTTFDALLMNDTFLRVGAGSATYTRATTARVFDHEDVARPCLSGEARFQGARRVGNNIQGSSQDFTNANWTKDAGGTGSVPVLTANYAVAPDGTTTATRVVFDRGAGATAADFSRIYQIPGSSGYVRHSGYVKSNTGSSQTLVFFANGVQNLLNVTASWTRFAFASPSGNSYWWVSTAGDQGTTRVADFLLWGAQQEYVSGQSNQAPGEYVSVGAEKLNGLIYTQDFDNATGWGKSSVTVTANAIAAPDGTLTADKIVEVAASAAHGVTQTQTTPTLAGTTYTSSCYAKAGERSWTMLQLTTIAFGATTRAWFDLSLGVVGTVDNGSAAITDAGNGWYRCVFTATTSVGGATTTVWHSTTGDGVTSFLGDITKGLYLWGAQITQGTSAGTYFPVSNVYPFHGAMVDGVKYFATTNGNSVSSNVVTEATGTPISDATIRGYLAEPARTNSALWSRDMTNAAWVKTTMTAAQTATGVDGIINSATTLTATAGNATVLQTLVAAATTRGYAPYIKRISGVGAVQITQDGIAWTTVTITSAWTRVTPLILSQLNPVFGIRLVDNADSVAVDMNQFETTTGTVVYGPIVTTTAAVTRNADVLTYQYAGNSAEAAGTLYAETSSVWSAGSDGLASMAVSFGGGVQTSPMENTFTIGATSFQQSDGTTNNGKAGLASTATGVRKRASSWGAIGQICTGDGLAPGVPQPYDGSYGSTAVGIGCNPATGVQTWGGTVRRVRLSLPQFTATQLSEITA